MARRGRRGTGDTGPSKLTLDCDICGEPMEIDRLRYVAMMKAGERPRCRKNGCERLCGAKNPATSRRPEVLDVIAVPPATVLWPSEKKGRKNGALAKLAVRRGTVESCGGHRENE